MRVIAYSRVSSEEQVAGYSLDAQRRAMQKEAERRGLTIVADLSDEGKSAKHDTLERRPGFRAAVDMVKAGQADAIMVHKPDRAARNLRLLLEVLHLLGGNILAVEGDFDYTTPEGKLRAHIMGSVAQWYSDNLAREVKKGKDERRRQGLWNARLPFGVKKRPDDDHGRMPPIPDTDPVLCSIADRREWSRWDCLSFIFERAAVGDSLPTILRQIHTIGFPLGLGTVWEILSNRFYLGEISVTDSATRKKIGWLPGAHDALIDPELFERAARQRESHHRGSANIRKHARVYPLSGLCRCARCGDAFHCRTDERGKFRIFCHTRHKSHECDQPYVLAESIEQQALLFLRRYAPPQEYQTVIVEQLTKARRDTRREHASIEQRLRRLRELYKWGDLVQEEYLREREDLERQKTLLEAPAANDHTTAWLMRYLRDFGSGYADATSEERNGLLREIFDVIVVDEGKVQKVALKPAFDGILRHYVAEAFGSSGLVETVCPVVPTEDGMWLVPPLEIAKRLTPFIPKKYWPQIAADHAAGVRVVDLASQWDVSHRTIRRVLARGVDRQSETQPL